MPRVMPKLIRASGLSGSVATQPLAGLEAFSFLCHAEELRICFDGISPQPYQALRPQLRATMRRFSLAWAAGWLSRTMLVLQRLFKEGCAGMREVRLGAWRGSAWPVRYYPAYPRATATTHPARTVPGAAFPAPPGRPAAS